MTYQAERPTAQYTQCITLKTPLLQGYKLHTPANGYQWHVIMQDNVWPVLYIAFSLMRHTWSMLCWCAGQPQRAQCSMAPASLESIARNHTSKPGQPSQAVHALRTACRGRAPDLSVLAACAAARSDLLTRQYLPIAWCLHHQ